MINRKHLNAFIILCCISALLAGCDTMGQIGDSYSFHTSKDTLERAIDTLFAKYPEYKMPQKWEQYNTLKPRPAPYLENKYFYFKDRPEEMYYVVLVDNLVMNGDSSHSALAIRAVNTGRSKWLLESDLGYRDERRISKRFDSLIVSKLKLYTGAKVRKEE